jgi:hypothetical protein
VVKNLQQYIGEQKVFDDISLLILKRKWNITKSDYAGKNMKEKAIPGSSMSSDVRGRTASKRIRQRLCVDH